MIPLDPILLVEDNAVDAELTVRVLKKIHFNHEIAVVRHGGEALDYLYRRGSFKNRDGGDPPLVLLDLKMPKVNGLEVLREVKSEQHLRNIPVVMFTSSSQEVDLRQAYQLGANAYVVKPVAFNELSEVLGTIASFWIKINNPAPDFTPLDS